MRAGTEATSPVTQGTLLAVAKEKEEMIFSFHMTSLHVFSLSLSASLSLSLCQGFLFIFSSQYCTQYK